MAINTAFFNQLKSALVPLLKRVIALIPTKTSDLTNDSGFLTAHQSLSAYATKTYADGKDQSYVVNCDLNLATLEVTNLTHGGVSCTFADAMAAVTAGKTPEIWLSFTSIFNVPCTAVARMRLFNSTLIEFSCPLETSFGAGDRPYLIVGYWYSNGSVTITPIQLGYGSN